MLFLRGQHEDVTRQEMLRARVPAALDAVLGSAAHRNHQLMEIMPMHRDRLKYAYAPHQ